MHRLYLLIVLTLSCSSIYAFQKQGEPTQHRQNNATMKSAADNNQGDTNEAQPRGEMLYGNHCRACHESNAHVREKRRAKSFADILSWVTRWSTHLNLGWSGEDIDQVARHLNKTYYKFSDSQ